MTEEIMNEEEESPEGDFPDYPLPEVPESRPPIEVHTVDIRGVYLTTMMLDPMGPQPPGAVYESESSQLPEELAGHTRMRVAGAWVQVLDSEVPAYPDTPAAVVPVPQEVTMGQCRLALFDHYKIESDEEFLALTDLLPEDQRARARLELRTRTSVRRDNPLVIGLGAAKGWDLDELFTYAAGL